MRLRVLAGGAAALALLAGCQSDATVLPDGSYSGSTAGMQTVNVNVNGDAVTLDGITMKYDPADKSFLAEHDTQVRMTCRTAFKQTELMCTIDRHGLVETDELMKL